MEGTETWGGGGGGAQSGYRGGEGVGGCSVGGEGEGGVGGKVRGSIVLGVGEEGRGRVREEGFMGNDIGKGG